MKISNSKKQLAKIIHENGGWRDGAESAWFQGRNAGKKCREVWFGAYGASPEFKAGVGFLSYHSKVIDRFTADQFDNWHQTVLSRDEYSHLYPEHTETEYKDGVKPTDPAKVEGPSKPTIEQLAADYRNRKDYADRKQQEADAAKADAEAKLAELVAAGKALGLVLSVEPAQKYTGKFYKAKLGAPSHYKTGPGDEICEGCGRRFGDHIGILCGGNPNA